MSSVANVIIHASQFPENVRRDLLESLRTRRVNHKFHYDSVKQTQKWLALHQACSPTRNDSGLPGHLSERLPGGHGPNQIAARSRHRSRLWRRTKGHAAAETVEGRGKEVFYTPCDVSTAMVLIARQTALTVLPEKNCFPFVCDLATADDLRKFGRVAVSATQTFGRRHAVPPDMTSLVTFFGMIPNFEPQDILPKLASLIRPKDFLLFSANLAPGADYAAGMKKILPQYDNRAHARLADDVPARPRRRTHAMANCDLRLKPAGPD